MAIHLIVALLQETGAAEPEGGLIKWDPIKWGLDLVPMVVTFMIFFGMRLALLKFEKRREATHGTEGKFGIQVTQFILLLTMVISVILASPMDSETTGQVLQLVTVAITAAIALSSTTLVANAMGGLMLKMMRSFKPGDYISVDGQEGRVISMGLVHTEVQNSDRDIVAVPNQLMVSNATTVVRSSGTYISATVGLGYDVPHSLVQELCVEAAKDSGLEEPFVHVMDLGDFSVTYRVAGFLPEVKRLLTARSRLRKAILAHLHGAGVEIASPTLMTQRVFDKDAKIIPKRVSKSDLQATYHGVIEEKVFDIAEEAEKVEELRKQRDELLEAIEEAKKALSAAGDDEAKAKVSERMEKMATKLEHLNKRVERLSATRDERS